MKTFAHYDSEGDIRAFLTVNAPKGMSMGLTPRPGEYVADITGAKLKIDPSDIEGLRKIANTQRIANPQSSATLTRKR